MYIQNGGRKEKSIKKYCFHITFLICVALPIILLVVLDYLNIESFYLFNQRFLFNETWKGRMFYLFFVWVISIESIIDLEEIVKKKPQNHIRILIFFLVVNIPLFYTLAVNFLGLEPMIIELGRFIGINPGEYFLFLAWPLSFEYLVFFSSFFIATIFAYKIDGLKFFSISLTLLGVMTFIYIIDTYYPEGLFKPLQLFALPTAACAAALLDILGYNFSLIYTPGPKSLPIIRWPNFGNVGIVWSCAGVHSLFLYILIIALFFKRTNILSFRKLLYFVIGAFCTYFVNILRIVSFFVILEGSGKAAAQYFHDSIGELYFLFWISIYILIIISIERFALMEKLRLKLRRALCFLERLRNEIILYLRKDQKKAEY